jgi:tRNA modification GTPase
MSAAVDDTIVALSTAPGKAGIAIVRISGPRAFGMIQQRLRLSAGRQPSMLHAKARLCWLHDAQGQRLDRALVLAFHPPHSYTGEALVELHLHGSPWLVDHVLTDLGREARLAARGEFTRRAVERGRLSLAQAEATLELLEARSRIAHQLAIRGLAGETERRIHELQERVVRLRALIEAELDFAEHEITPTPAARLRTEAEDVGVVLERWLSTWRIGRLAHGAQVVLAGAPNAGKSTLMNALLGEARMLVDEAPGTTRDAVSQSLLLGDLEITLWDTAGLCETDDPVERQGVARTRLLLEQADLVLQVQAPGDPDPAPLDNGLLICSKADLGKSAAGLAVSALTGAGRPELLAAIRARLLGAGWEQLDLVLTEARHRQLLETALAAIRRVAAGLMTDGDRALVAADLLEVGQALDEIAAPLNPDPLYDAIFSRFCVGK